EGHHQRQYRVHGIAQADHHQRAADGNDAEEPETDQLEELGTHAKFSTLFRDSGAGSRAPEPVLIETLLQANNFMSISLTGTARLARGRRRSALRGGRRWPATAAW